MTQTEQWDLLIRGAQVYDGSGAPPVQADVAVRDDRITAVGDLARPAEAGGPVAARGRAGRELDATGLALAPGFIDVHSHDDFAVHLRPEMDFKVLQGVTTEVVGNCGMGAAPFPQASVFARALHPDGALEAWKGYAGYLSALDQAPPSLNVSALVGHGTVRAAAMGGDARAPDERELGAMREAVREGIEAGAVGLSSGLIYEPGRHARTDELITLARELAGSGALYATHMRDEGRGLLRSVREAIEIGEASGIPVQISHHKASERAAWGLVAQSLVLIEEACARGVDTTADQYPYTAGSTILAAVVDWLSANRAPEERGDPAEVVISSAPHHPEWEGRGLEAIAAEWSLEAEPAARRILELEPATWVVLHSMCEDDVCRVLRHPSTMIGSDGVPTDGGKPHPRLYGTFARVLGHYVRDTGLLSLEEAVHRMTGAPARKFHLSERGAVRAGAFADLVVFDPERIADVATWQSPRQHPEGIAHVFVNGRAVVKDGRHTGERPGRALRRG